MRASHHTTGFSTNIPDIRPIHQISHPTDHIRSYQICPNRRRGNQNKYNLIIPCNGLYGKAKAIAGPEPTHHYISETGIYRCQMSKTLAKEQKNPSDYQNLVANQLEISPKSVKSSTPANLINTTFQTFSPCIKGSAANESSCNISV